MHDNNDNRIWKFQENKKGGKNKTPPHGDLTAALSRDHFSLIDCHSSKIVHLVCSRDHVTLKTMMKNIYKSRWTGSALISCKEKNTFKRCFCFFVCFFSSSFFCRLSVILIHIYIYFLILLLSRSCRRGSRLHLCILFSFTEVYCVKCFGNHSSWFLDHFMLGFFFLNKGIVCQLECMLFGEGGGWGWRRGNTWGVCYGG